jgi:serine/threonine protein kinase
MSEFPRDLSPTFIETRYSSRKEMPYTDCGPLGHGGQSEGVRKVRDQNSDQFYAMKTIDYASGASRKQVHSELKSMRRLCHSHIVKLRYGFEIVSEAKYGLLIQPVADSNLGTFLETCAEEGFPATSLDKLNGWFSCLLNALDYLHNQKIKHRDIKPSNILVKDGMVYLTDFGIARDWTNSTSDGTIGPIKAGTKRYMAPEAYEFDEQRTKAVDIFSLGCVFAEMATVLSKRDIKAFFRHRVDSSGEDPFYENLDGPLDSWLESTPTYNGFVQKMLARRAEDRPSTGELISMIVNGDIQSYKIPICQHGSK